MTATRLVLVRHAQSEWNAIGRWQGQADPPLSILGHRQAAGVGAVEVDAVVSSTLARAYATAEAIAAASGIEHVELDPRLQERDAGEWEGLTRDELGALYPGAPANGVRPPGFELDDAVWTRVRPSLIAIAERHRGANVLVVTHGGVMGAITAAIGDGPGPRTWPIPNLAGIVVEVLDDHLAVVEWHRLQFEE